MFALFFVNYVFLCTSCEPHLRLIGGRDALQGEFSYVVRLEEKINESTIESIFNYEMFCTGAALTSKWVLSAAHCVDDVLLDAESLSIVTHKIFARYNSYFPNNIGIVAPIVKTITHPGWTNKLRLSVKFDICLIRCNTNISRYGKINAIDFNSLIGHEALSLGFGRTNSSLFVKPVQVLKGMLNRCLEIEVEEVTPHMICLSRPCGIEATICGGDSGGPVVHASGIVGVHSMSADDCDEHTKILKLTPGTSAAIISPISPVVDWLQNIISK